MGKNAPSFAGQAPFLPGFGDFEKNYEIFPSHLRTAVGDELRHSDGTGAD